MNSNNLETESLLAESEHQLSDDVALEIVSVSHSYDGERFALDDVSIKIQ